MDKPNGYIVGDLLAFGDPPKVVSAGYLFEAPNLSNGSDSTKTEWHLTMRSFLKRISGDLHCQVFHSTDCDYETPLEEYNQKTLAATGPAAAVEVRQEIYQRYHGRMESRQLRREVLRVYLSKPITSTPPIGLSRAKEVDFWNSVFNEAEGFFNLQLAMLQSTFARTGARITMMTQQDLARHYFQYLQPHRAQHVANVEQEFIPDLTLHGNFLSSGTRGGLGNSVPYGFTHDGYFYNVFTFKRWPDESFPGVFATLTTLRLLDYCVVANLYPLNPEVAAKQQKSDLRALRGASKSGNEADVEAQIEMKRNRIRGIKSGETSPYELDLAVIVWAATQEELAKKSAAARTAILNMTGAKYHEPALDTTCRKLWMQLWPGYVHGSYRTHALYLDDACVADVLPFSSTNTLSLDKCDAIFDGDNGHLVGLRLFVGKTPQHCIIFGSSGSGKSWLMHILLLQTGIMFSLTIIIGEGNDYVNYCKKVGAKPRYVHPDSKITINPFDTRGLPLTDSQVAVCSALFTLMSGAPKDQDKYALRRAIITEYIHMFCEEHAEDYLRQQPHLTAPLAKEAMVVLRRIEELDIEDPNFTDSYLAFELLGKENPVAAKEALDAITDREAITFSQDQTGRIHLRNLIFAKFKSDEYPQLTPFVDFVRSRTSPHHDLQEVQTLSTLLRTWTRHHGAYGGMFDGATNVPFSDPDQYWELGRLGEGDSELKAIVGFLLTNQARSEILRRPRSERKRVIFEEVSRFLAVPGGEKIVKEFYAQMRKYNVWVCALVQQYSQFSHTNESIKEILLGNSKLRLIFRQESRQDLEELAEQLRLPDSARDAIAALPMSEHFEGKAEESYSSCLVVAMTAQRPLIGTLRYYASAQTREEANAK